MKQIDGLESMRLDCDIGSLEKLETAMRHPIRKV